MPDSKDIAWNRAHSESADSLGDKDGAANSRPANGASSESDAADPDGWQQYRRWISKAPAPKGRRSNLDPSLYTWKGYRNWTEQIKRNWSDS